MSAPATKDLEAPGETEESQPLQKDAPEKSGYGSTEAREDSQSSTETSKGPKRSRTETQRKALSSLIWKSSVQDSMTYHMQDLSSWTSVTNLTYSVWHRRSLWMVTVRLLFLSLIVASILVLVVKEPHELKTFRFTEIGNFLRVFVGLLLGFFMSASVQRWWACAGSFQSILSAVRELHMYLNGLGVSEEQLKTCLSYGVGSAWILHMQLHVEAMPPEEQKEAVKAGWDSLRDTDTLKATDSVKDSEWDFMKTFSEEDIDTLQGTTNPASLLWMWIASYVGFLAQEGEIPPLASPTYGRIMGVVSVGFNSIRDVRASISMQAPYIYVQMLASLVHINNIVNAISFGLTSGASMGTLLLFHGEHPASDASVKEKEVSVDIQSLLVSFFFSCFGPFIYQALLEVSVAIAQPFSNKDAVIPTDRMIKGLERDLHDALMLAKKVPWQQPRFKKPA